MWLDCFIRNVSLENLESVYDEYADYFVFKPVPIWIDNGTESEPDPELLGYHVKVKAGFYNKAKAQYPGKIYLYQEVDEKLRTNGCPLHVFGPGGGIDTAIDTDDETTFCRFNVQTDFGLTGDRKKAFKIDAGNLAELTAQEITAKGIELDNESN